MRLLGEDHLKYYRIKQALENVDDASFNKLARTVNKDPTGKTDNRQGLRPRADQASATDSGGGEILCVNRLGYE